MMLSPGGTELATQDGGHNSVVYDFPAASAGEIARAVEQGAVTRLFLVSLGSKERDDGGLRLARALAACGRSTVLIDLLPGRQIGVAMGAACPRLDEAPDVLALLEERAVVADVVQSDQYTNAHLVASGGLALASIDASMVETLNLFLTAFDEVYDNTVVLWPADAIARLPAFMDDGSAVIAHSASGGPSSRWEGPTARALKAEGICDLIYMVPVREG